MTNNSTTKLPANLRQYLWDLDLSQLDTQEHSFFIIERFLEYGDISAIAWLQENYSQQEITQVLKTSRKISAKSGYFFALLYQLEPSNLRCIQKPYTQKQNRF